MPKLYGLVALAFACLLAWPLSAVRHETWLEVRSPNFIVVSNAGEKQARNTAVQFEQIRAVYRKSVPGVSTRPSPVITILAVKDEDSLRALLPEYWVKGHSHPAGFFYYRMNQYYAAIQLDAQGTNPYETIYHEYYHSVTLPYFPNLPLWVAEGLADFYGNTIIGDKDAGIGYPDPDLIAELKEGRFIPLETLFKVDQTSPYYNEQNKTTIFYAESWALVHYLMVGDRAAHRQKFVDYLTALNEGATQNEAAAKAFGDVKKLEGALMSYISNLTFYYMKSPAPPKVSEADLKVRQISDAEADAYRGGFLAARGRTQDAKPLLQDALRLDPKLALAYQNMGLAEYVDGQRSEALASVSQAISLDPKNGLAHFLRAYLSFGGGEPVSDSQVEDDLREAISASPEFGPAYSLLAVYLAADGEELPEALSLAQKAIAFEPGNGSFQLALAQVLAQMKRFDEAHIAGLRALEGARSPDERAHADSFLSYLQRLRSFQASASAGADPSVAGGDTSPVSEQKAESPDENDKKEMKEVTGEAISENCKFGGPSLEIKAGAESIQLRAPAGGGVQIMTSSKPPAGFNPCTSLGGAQVEVHYKPDDAKGLTGTVWTIRVLAMREDGNNASSPASAVPNETPQADSRVTATSGGIYKPNAAPGATTTAEGKITEESCNGSELQLTMLVRGTVATLHARNYSRIEVEQEVAFETGEFNICTELKGKTANITFAVVAHKPYIGEIQRIEVEK